MVNNCYKITFGLIWTFFHLFINQINKWEYYNGFVTNYNKN